MNECIQMEGGILKKYHLKKKQLYMNIDISGGSSNILEVNYRKWLNEQKVPWTRRIIMM